MIVFAPPIWITLMFAAAAAGGMWFLYRRGSPHLRNPFSWLLPLLRSAAVFLIVMTLTEPTLRRSVDQQLLSRVRFIVDESASMDVADPGLPLDEKVEIALAHGWLDEGAVDLTKLREAQRLGGLRQALLESGRGDASLDAARRAATQVAEAGIGGVSEPAKALLREDWIPSRAREIQLRLNQFTQDLSEREAALRAEFRAEAEAEGVAMGKFDGMSRLARVRDVLEIAKELEGKHEVGIETLGSPGGLSDLTAIDPPGADLARAETLILLSDGRHNAETAAPADVAELWSSAGAQLFTVGFGSPEPRPDLILTNTRQPRRVAPGDTISGAIEIYDTMPPGRQLLVEIADADEVVWSDEVETTGQGARVLAFSFEVSAETTELPALLNLSACIRAVEGESRADNNTMPMPVFLSIPARSSMLILDGRPRWESRYIKNIFARDPNWRVESNFEPPETTLPARDELLTYDLIIFGEVPPAAVSDQHIQWLEEAVREGVGLILIDGARQHLRERFGSPEDSLSPVAWFDAPQWLDDPRLELTADGALEPALTLAANRADNEAIWSYLPAPKRAIRARPKAGATVLAEVRSESGNTPFLVTRNLGQGRVLYVSSDESWRWRYQKGDEYHTRYWRQLARWIMAEPFLVGNDDAQFDLDRLRIRDGESARVRARFRDVENASAEAILLRDGAEITRTPLAAGIEPPGPGAYEVRLEGAELPAIPLTVVKSTSVEETVTHANQQLLAGMARRGGGEFLAEQDFNRLREVFAAKKVIVTNIDSSPVWRTFGWLAAIVLLVAAELFLRKRAGLL